MAITSGSCQSTDDFVHYYQISGKKMFLTSHNPTLQNINASICLASENAAWNARCAVDATGA